MLAVFAKDEYPDGEDCWTQPAIRARQYVSDLEWDLTTQVNRAAILAEVNDTLRGLIDGLAAYTGAHFGVDETMKNFERVRKALTDKPEQPAPASTPPIRAVAGTSLACAKCGCRWKRHADGSFQLYDADQRPCVECDNAPNSPLRPETPDDAPASTPDEGEVETPVQPIVTDKHGVTRFKANAIVAYIVDWCARKNGTVGYGPDPDGPAPDLSEISRMAFSRDDRVQLAQLIGYSLSGFEELGYVESADVHRALRLSSSRTPRVDVRRLLADFERESDTHASVWKTKVEAMECALRAQGVAGVEP